MNHIDQLTKELSLLKTFQTQARQRIQQQETTLVSAKEQSAFQRHEISDLKQQLAEQEELLLQYESQQKSPLSVPPPPPLLDNNHNHHKSQFQLDKLRKTCQEQKDTIQQLRQELKIAQELAESQERYRSDEVEDLRVLLDAQEEEFVTLRRESEEARRELEFLRNELPPSPSALSLRKRKELEGTRRKLEFPQPSEESSPVKPNTPASPLNATQITVASSVDDEDEDDDDDDDDDDIEDKELKDTSNDESGDDETLAREETVVCELEAKSKQVKTLKVQLQETEMDVKDKSDTILQLQGLVEQLRKHKQRFPENPPDLPCKGTGSNNSPHHPYSYDHRQQPQAPSSSSPQAQPNAINRTLKYAFDEPYEGRLGLIIQCDKQQGPLVHGIRETSPLQGLAQIGDKITEVDGHDTRRSSLSEIVQLLSCRRGMNERILFERHYANTREEDEENSI